MCRKHGSMEAWKQEAEDDYLTNIVALVPSRKTMDTLDRVSVTGNQPKARTDPRLDATPTCVSWPWSVSGPSWFPYSARLLTLMLLVRAHENNAGQMGRWRDEDGAIAMGMEIVWRWEWI
jgi:hypothetical protein